MIPLFITLLALIGPSAYADAEPIGVEVTYRSSHSVGVPLPIIVETWTNSRQAANETSFELKLPPKGVQLKSGKNTVKVRGPLEPGKRIRHAFLVVATEKGEATITLEITQRFNETGISRTIAIPICADGKLSADRKSCVF
jgi:hypothetical protein